MTEEVWKELYRIEIPLPQYYPKSVNAYVVKDKERSIIIDTGLQDENCLHTMLAAIRKIGIDQGRIDFFITHGHGDHAGLVPRLINAESTVFINRLEADFIKKMESGALFLEFQLFFRACGLPEGHFEKIVPRIMNFAWRDISRFQFLKDGDTLERGQYRFICIETPGHNKGHMCLYEPEKKFLISGDHLLKNAIPPVVGRIDNENPLRKYLSSLDKVIALDPDMVLPGHGRPFRYSRQRIEEIKEHHHERNRKILAVMKHGPMTVYEISLRMTRRTVSNSTDLLSVFESFLNAEDVFTHLTYLLAEGKIERGMEGQSFIYSLRENI